MLSREALREQAQRLPAVLVPSETLLELLDAADRAPKRRKPRDTEQQDKDAAEDEKCARWLFDVLRGTMPKAREPNFTVWAKDVRLMRERDDRTRKEICELFRWAHSDSFWCSNILSPAKLRDHWDRLSIQRAKAAEPKQRGDWWKSDATRLAKAVEVGVGPAHFGESLDSWEARIRAAIDNGGKPPAPPRLAPVVTPPPAAPAPAAHAEKRAPKPEGIGALRDLVRRGPPPARAA